MNEVVSVEELPTLTRYRIRGPLAEEQYRPQFSGHETFPLRYGWLKKAYDAVAGTSEILGENKSAFSGEDAIARFGVGKNMVSSIRHWASVCGVLEDEPNSPRIKQTKLGHLLFGNKGIDPYLENPSSVWLLHWQLAALPHKTTWFWAFNHFNSLTFDRDHLVNGIARLATDRMWRRVSQATIRSDVACFIRTYAALPPTKRSGNDSMLESPLVELGMIKATGKRDGFRFVRGPKRTMGDGVFAYATMDFWSRHSRHSATLSFEAIAHEPGGPGKVFLLDENDVVDRLVKLNETTRGKMSWSETAGLKQVVRDPKLKFDKCLALLKVDYAGSFNEEAVRCL